MKKYIAAFAFSAIWLLFVFWFFSNYYWYRRIAIERWGFIFVNVITLFPVLLVLFVTDRMQPANTPVDQPAANAKQDPRP